MNALIALVALSPVFLVSFSSFEPESQPQTLDAASVREAVEARYHAWGEARIAYDRPTLEAMLAPDFFVQLADRKVLRDEFAAMVSQKNPAGALTRFDVEILSVQKSGDDWQLVICEKLEWTLANAEDAEPTVFSLWVTRDGWRHTDGQWLVTYSEEIGHENWRDSKPPIKDW